MLSVAKGACHSIFVYDVAFSIELNEVERRITSSKQRETIRHKRRAPRYFEYHPAPIRISQDAVELVVYDFGAVSVIYRMPLGEQSPDLLSLSQDLYENERLLGDSRKRVEELLKIIEPAVSKPNISDFVEDYLIFHVEAFTEAIPIKDLVTRRAQDVAQILRAEELELSEEEVTDAVSNRISYGKDDIAIVDWNAALVVDKEPEDVLTVLEFANVELIEMRFLDRRAPRARP